MSMASSSTPPSDPEAGSDELRKSVFETSADFRKIVRRKARVPLPNGRGRDFRNRRGRSLPTLPQEGTRQAHPGETSAGRNKEGLRPIGPIVADIVRRMFDAPRTFDAETTG